MSQSLSKVHVAVRLKPELRSRRCVFQSPAREGSLNVGDKSFHFDQVFDENCSQHQVYETCVSPLVKGCFKGFNATVFAYGQTGSGKTHSIVGLPRVADDEGIIPRALRQIFKHLSADRSGRVVSLHVSFLEIYNDECRDLLHPDIPSRDIMIREDRDGRIFFTGAREEVVTNIEDAFYHLERGNLSRTTAETYMNATSSRSHAIFSISIELFEYNSAQQGGGTAQEDPQEMSTENTYIHSKLHLVDLAGSERAKRTGAEGARLKESVGINQGLLALGKVIRALTAGGGKSSTHVPYRDSKLTRFLQDSLGGNSRTVMLACVSPSELNVHETLSTLQYASRARAVQNKLVANVSVGVHHLPPEADSGLVGALRTQLQLVQQELEKYKASHHAYTSPSDYASSSSSSSAAAAAAAAMVRRSASLDADLRRSREAMHSPKRPSQATAAAQHLNLAALDDMMRVVSEAQSALQEAFESLGSAAHSPQACGIAWRVVCACGDAAAALEDVLEQSKQLHTLPPIGEGGLSHISLVDSLEARGHGVRASSEEIRQLRAELDECREDLKRDEDIFAEKVRELKRARKEIRDLQQENLEVNAKLTEAQQSAGLLLRITTTTPTKAAVAVAAAAAGASFAAQSKSSPIAPPPARSRLEEEVDDLEVSLAVAVTEPDISQLMEDLEAITREKEKVLSERNLAESKCNDAASAAQQQREEFVRNQEELSRRLKELEINIRHKQELIAELTRGQNEATQLAERHEARVLLLEQEQSTLQSQLSYLNQARRQTFEEAEEERARRKQLEAKLLEAQEQLAAMEQQRRKQEKKWRAEREAEEKRRAEAKRTEEHLQELTSLQSSYAKVTAQLEHNEHKHRKDLDALTSQVAQFKRSSSEAQAQIKTLEAKNGDLRVRLERLAKTRERSASAPRPPSQGQSPGQGLSQSLGPPPLPGGGSSGYGSGGGGGGGGGMSVASGGSSRPRSRHSSSPGHGVRGAGAKGTTPNDDASVVSHGSALSQGSSSSHSTAATASTARRAKQFSPEWLLQRVDELSAAKHARLECSRLLSSCRAADRERSELLAEQEQLLAQQKDGEGVLRRQLREVESRLEKYAQVGRALKAELAVLDDSASAPGARQELKAKISSTEKTLRAHLDHRRELEQRLQTGALSSDALARLQDIKDELETVETELSLNEVRLGEEKRRIRKAGLSVKASGVGSRPAGAGAESKRGGGEAEAASEAVNTMLYQEMEQLAVASTGRGFSDQDRGAFVALAQLGQELVDVKFRAGVDSHSVQQLQQKLEEKHSECEDLLAAMHKARSEALRRQEQQRAESEDKIAALLAQLRAAEAKLMETSTSLRKSQDLGSLGLRASASSSVASISNGGGGGGGLGSLASALRKSDADLSAYVQELLSEDVDGDGGGSGGAMGFQREIVKRWASEKERREALEKRNAELVRELRALRGTAR